MKRLIVIIPETEEEQPRVLIEFHPQLGDDSHLHPHATSLRVMAEGIRSLRTAMKTAVTNEAERVAA